MFKKHSTFRPHIEMESSKNALVVKDPSSNALLNKKAWLKLNFIVNRDY
jgi:hypothetical protein